MPKSSQSRSFARLVQWCPSTMCGIDLEYLFLPHIKYLKALHLSLRRWQQSKGLASSCMEKITWTQNVMNIHATSFVINIWTDIEIWLSADEKEWKKVVDEELEHRAGDHLYDMGTTLETFPRAKFARFVIVRQRFFFFISSNPLSSFL